MALYAHSVAINEWPRPEGVEHQPEWRTPIRVVCEAAIEIPPEIPSLFSTGSSNLSPLRCFGGIRVCASKSGQSQTTFASRAGQRRACGHNALRPRWCPGRAVVELYGQLRGVDHTSPELRMPPSACCIHPPRWTYLPAHDWSRTTEWPPPSSSATLQSVGREFQRWHAPTAR